MQLHNLKPRQGAKHKKKILGHGEGSGHGGSSTRGMKGQKSRSGGAKPKWFEGGQTPLLRRIPKRGFSNTRFERKYSIINLETLEKNFDSNSIVDPAILIENKMIKKGFPVKILGDGELTKSLIIKAHKFSKSAVDKINSSGGKTEVIAGRCDQ